MNRILCLALSVAALSMMAVPSAHARRDRALEAATTLESEADKLKNDYKEHLKDIEAWKPRGREEHLYNSMEHLADAADALSKELSHGWSRQAERTYSVTMQYVAEVARSIGLVRDRKVRDQWEEVQSIAHRLAEQVSGGRGRFDDRDRDSRRGYGRTYDDRGEYEDRDRRRYREREDGETRTIRFW